MTENEIIKACIKQERKSQEALYELFYVPGMRICLRYAKNKEEAKIILHEGFKKIFPHLGEFNNSSSLEVWIKKKFVKTAVSYLKSNQKEYAEIINDTGYPRTNGEEKFFWRTNDDILKALQGLPSSYRIVFNLHILEERSHEEISQQLEINEGSSVSILAKAKFSFKKNLLLANKTLAEVNATTEEIDMSIKEALEQSDVPPDLTGWVEMEKFLASQPVFVAPLVKYRPLIISLCIVVLGIGGYFVYQEIPWGENQTATTPVSNQVAPKEIIESEKQIDSVIPNKEDIGLNNESSIVTDTATVIDVKEKEVLVEKVIPTKKTSTPQADTAKKTVSGSSEMNVYSSISKPVWDFPLKGKKENDTKKTNSPSGSLKKENLFDAIHHNALKKKNSADSIKSDAENQDKETDSPESLGDSIR